MSSIHHLADLIGSIGARRGGYGIGPTTWVAIVLVLTTCLEATAAPVFLSCTGKASIGIGEGKKPVEFETDFSAAVDITNNTLTIDEDVYQITNISGNVVTAGTSGPLPGERTWITLDRVTGAVSTMTTFNENKYTVRSFTGACKSTNKLF